MAELKTTLKPSFNQDEWLSLALRIDWEKATYIAFFVIAIISRIAGLGDRVVSHDESLHTQYSYQFYNGEGYAHTPLMHGPFLFHITALSYWLFGHSDFTARLPVALFGVLLVVIPYFFRDWIGRKGALFASFIFLISPYVTYYSRYIRHDVYVIVWALIIFGATWYYLRDGEEKYLWWFSGGLALMFATKEVAFIYVAIFGSFTVVRLIGQVWGQPWLKKSYGKLKLPLITVAIGVIMLGIGLGGKSTLETQMEAATTAAQSQDDAANFAADPNAEIEAAETAPTEAGIVALGWLQIAGIVTASLGLFLLIYNLRDHLEQFREFDLIILYTTLILPTISPFLVNRVGWNPLDYSLNQCNLPGQESMGSFELVWTRLFTADCWSVLFSSGSIRTALFLLPLLIVSVLVGLWWRSKTWIICAAIFQIIFTLLYTSVFTNPSGWLSGTVGSLGYWLEQQEVQRGSQPWFYYGFVLPFYEFLPLIFAMLAMRLWAIKHKIHKLTAYWIWIAIAAATAFSFVNWYVGKSVVAQGGTPNSIPGYIALGIILLAAVFYWFSYRIHSC